MCDIFLATWCNDIYIDQQNKTISYAEVYLRGGMSKYEGKVILFIWFDMADGKDG